MKTPTARLLMCRPDYFGVTYAINPWMDPTGWAQNDRPLTLAAHREWAALHRTLTALGAAIELVSPAAGVPDLVFTANAAVVLDRKVLLARFRHPERQREEAHFSDAFRSLQARGLVDGVRSLPDGQVLEGAGDCVFDSVRNLFWLGYGPRSDATARHTVEHLFGIEAVALELADARFYHMDTALCPLAGGEVMYVPGAFTPAGLGAIRDRVAARDRIEIGPDDAQRLAANAVCLGDAVVMSGCSDELHAILNARGYRVVTTPLAAFRRSGGSAFCLTLRLDNVSKAADLDRPAVA